MIYKSPATTFVTVSDGAPATSYSVVPSVTTMTRNVSNTVLSPASVTFSAYAKTGEAAQEAYTGYLYAECSYDGGGTCRRCPARQLPARPVRRRFSVTGSS